MQPTDASKPTTPIVSGGARDDYGRNVEITFDGTTLRVYTRTVFGGRRQTLEVDASLVEGVNFEKARGRSKGSFLLGLPDGTRQEWWFRDTEGPALQEMYEEVASRLVAARDALGRASDIARGRSEFPRVGPETAGVTHLHAIRPVELIRHFDTHEVGQTVGSLELALSLSGSVRQSIGNLATPSWAWAFPVGLSGGGRGSIQLTHVATTRTDVRDEGFLTVLETSDESGADTFRLVVPPLDVISETIAATLARLNRHCGRRRLGDTDLSALVSALAQRIPWESSYVADRLSAYARRQTPVSAVGSVVAPHVLAAGAVQFAPGAEWHQLVPHGLFAALTPVRDRSRVFLE